MESRGGKEKRREQKTNQRLSIYPKTSLFIKCIFPYDLYLSPHVMDNVFIISFSHIFFIGPLSPHLIWDLSLTVNIFDCFVKDIFIQKKKTVDFYCSYLLTSNIIATLFSDFKM